MLGDAGVGTWFGSARLVGFVLLMLAVARGRA